MRTNCDQPTYYIVCMPKQPWEPRLDNGYPNVIPPEPGSVEWRLYYGDCVNGCAQQILLFANSSDGLSWTKPDLGIWGNWCASSLVFRDLFDELHRFSPSRSSHLPFFSLYFLACSSWLCWLKNQGSCQQIRSFAIRQGEQYCHAGRWPRSVSRCIRYKSRKSLETVRRGVRERRQDVCGRNRCFGRRAG